MVSTLETVLETIIAQLKADVGVIAVLPPGTGAEIPVFHARQKRKDVFPRITVMDIAVRSEVSGLDDGFDGTYVYQWEKALIQIDCYSSRDSTERDRVWMAAKTCLLKRAVKVTLRRAGIIYIHEPMSINVDSLQAAPAEYRKMMTYSVFWFSRA